MTKLTFTTVLLQAKKTATGIEVPESIVEQLGSGKRPAVSVTINGYTYRSTVAVMGGVYMLGVSADVREKTGVAGGDTIDVTLELDTAPREITVPEDLQQALNANPAALQLFETLSFSNKRRYVEPIADAKTEETRQRRIEKAVKDLSEGKK